jgi:hypothetical protein
VNYETPTQRTLRHVGYAVLLIATVALNAMVILTAPWLGN